MILLIDLTDFTDDGDGHPRVVISDNVDDATLNPHILSAQKYDFEPMVPANFYTALFASPVGPELLVFLNDFITPLLVFLSYSKYLLWMGKNPTQYGLKKTSDDTSEDVPEPERAELMNDIEQPLRIELSRFYKRLDEVKFIFDGVTYDFTDNRRKRIKNFRAVPGFETVPDNNNNFKSKPLS